MNYNHFAFLPHMYMYMGALGESEEDLQWLRNLIDARTDPPPSRRRPHLDFIPALAPSPGAAPATCIWSRLHPASLGPVHTVTIHPTAAFVSLPISFVSKQESHQDDTLVPSGTTNQNKLLLKPCRLLLVCCKRIVTPANYRVLARPMPVFYR